MGDLTNVFGGFVIEHPLNLAALPSVDEFNHDVARLCLDFVYLGVGTIVAVYLSCAFWIVTGERISRRIRR